MRSVTRRILPSAVIVAVAVAVAVSVVAVGVAAQSQDAIVVEDFMALPITGSPTGEGNAGSLARVSTMREEPGGRGRLFINDLNGPFYILDRKTKALTTYLDFNGRDRRAGLFARLPYEAGYQNGFMTFAFDPDYARNGVFYTLHMEEPGVTGSAIPNNTRFAGLALSGYVPTPAIRTPGDVQRESVLIEWTDTNISNATFEGTAREVLRLTFNSRIHPCGDLIFNPTARPGDADWRVLYVGCGDGGSGEQTGAVRQHPQRLDTLVGKILRIVPNPALHGQTSTVSENGRYRIPRDNPFAGVEGARPEIWAYGLRNPHRLAWDVDPVSGKDTLIAASIGLSTWEAVYIVHKGANYGYPAREGTELLQLNNRTAPLPAKDEVPVQITDTRQQGTTVPVYPVVQFPHTQDGGDAISGGFVYRGRMLPALVGKYIFGDVTTGRIWFAGVQEMRASDDGNAATLATAHPLQVRWDDPADSADGGRRQFPTMFPVALAAYTARGGKDADLPGRSTVSGPGRVDMRLAVDGAGELYILSKADGMIRAITSVTVAAPARN